MATKISTIIPLAVFLLVNVPPWFGFSYIVVVFRWATFQDTLTLGGNLVFPITYAAALLTLAVSAYLFRKRIGLSWISSLVLGTGLATAGAGLFELLWQAVGYMFYPNQITGGIWLANYVLNGSWIFLSVGSIQYWKISRRLLVTGIVFVAGWVVWIALGFPQVFQSAGLVAIVMNSNLKILSFVIFLSLVIFEHDNKRLCDPSPAKHSPTASSTIAATFWFRSGLPEIREGILFDFSAHVQQGHEHEITFRRGGRSSL